MAKVRLDGDQVYYELDITESRTNPDLFVIVMETFVRDATSRGPGNITLGQVGDPVALTPETALNFSDELRSLFAQDSSPRTKHARISDIIEQSGNGTNLYGTEWTRRQPLDFQEGPPLSIGAQFGNSIFFTWPRTLRLDWTKNSPATGTVSDRVRTAAELEGLQISENIEINLDGFSYSDIYFKPPTSTESQSSSRYVYIPYTYIFSEQLEAERAALIGEQGQSLVPSLEGIEEITEEQKESNLTINEQAILLFRIGELMQENKIQRSRHEGTRAYYDRFACLDYREGSKAANVSNHITSTTNLSPIFDSLKPIHFSAMIPKIRIFKSYLPNDKKARRDNNYPLRLVEFEFEEFSDTDILKSSLSTNTGVGITSFDWAFNGDNMFSAERLVNASLKLRAQSIDALDREIVNSTTGDRYSFTDLILPPAIEEEVKKENNVIQTAVTDRKQYELRVVVEYGVLNKKSEIWTDTLVKAVESLRLALNLNLSTHDLDLQPDGTVMVNLNLIGRVDASSADPNYANILSTKSELQQLADTTEQKQRLLEERRVLLDQAASFEQEAKEQQELEKKLKESQEAGGPDLTATERERLDAYQSTNVPASELISEVQRRNLLYGKDLTEEEYLAKVSSEFDKTLLYQRLINGLLEKDNVKVIRINPFDIANDEPIDIGVANQSIAPAAAGEFNTAIPKTREENISTIQELSSIFKSSVKPLYDGDNYFIKYFYFGDLVDVVLDGMLGASKDQRNDIRTLLGPIEIEKNKLSSTEFSSNVAFQNNGKIILTDLNGVRDTDKEKLIKKKSEQNTEQLIDAKTGVTQKEKIKIPTEKIVVNLADVPISLNLFLSWFAENVANQGVYSYSFQKFMVDSIQSLIVSALRADSTKLILPKQKRKIVTTHFESSAQPEKEDVFGFVYDGDDGLIVRNQQSGLFLVEDKLVGTNGRSATLPVFIPGNVQRDPHRYMADYLLVYAENVDYTRTYNNLPQEYRRDLSEGIYHLHAGRDAGVVKEIKLSAVNFAGYEEMRMLEAKGSGKPNTKRVYSASVTLSGVPIFRPGQKVFLNPAAYGTLSVLKKYGLVGYYSVIRTSSVIEAGQYQTTLECTFLGTG